MSVPPSKTSRSARAATLPFAKVGFAKVAPPEPRPLGADALAVRIVESPSVVLIDRLIEIERPLLIGRAPGIEGLAIDDKKMSSQHVLLDIAAGQITFVDQKSKNGTFFGGVKTTHGAMNDGDILRIGLTVLVATRRGPDGPMEDPAHDLVGVSPAFRRVCAEAAAVADATEPLGLLGDPGVEFEALARLVHRRGRGVAAPFVAVDCAVLQPERVADALFGAKGAFASADGGTLYLAEVGALADKMQARLLDVMTGATKKAARHAKVRVVTAIDPEVAPAITTGRFRADLYERLTTSTVQVPPLTARREDILRIARHHAELVAGQPFFHVEALEQLLAYAWPENRREVKQLVLRVATKKRPIWQADLPKTVVPGAPPLAPPEPIVTTAELVRRR